MLAVPGKADSLTIGFMLNRSVFAYPWLILAVSRNRTPPSTADDVQRFERTLTDSTVTVVVILYLSRRRAMRCRALVLATRLGLNTSDLGLNHSQDDRLGLQ